MSAVPVAKLANELLSHEDRSQQVHIHMNLAVVRINPGQSPVLKDSRAVDQRRDFAEFRRRLEDFHCGSSRIAKVCGHRESSTTGTANPIHENAGFNARCSVMHDDCEAAGGHRHCDLAADSASGSRHDGDATA